MRGLGSQNIDHRVRHADFGNVAAADAGKPSARWLGTSIAALSTLQSALVVGSFLRKDHPLFASRLRAATKKGCKVHSVHALQDDWLMPMAAGLTAAPSAWPQALADIASAIAATQGIEAPQQGEAGDAAKAIAASLLAGERKAVLLGHSALHHPEAGTLLKLATWIGERTGASVGYLGEAANSVGAQLIGAMPGEGGLHAGQMLGATGEAPLKAIVLLNVEPALDAANSAAAVVACHSAEMVVVLSPFKDAGADVADVMLPVAPFTETSGTYVSAEGRVQGVHGVVKPLRDTRPAWKVLRVLGNLLGLEGFTFESPEEVRDEALGSVDAIPGRLNNRPAQTTGAGQGSGDSSSGGLERIADVPIYATDSIVRRAPSLQLTADARPPLAHLSRDLWQRLGLAPGDAVRVTQGSAEAVLPAVIDSTLAATAVRVAAGHPTTAGLGAMFGPITVEKASAAMSTLVDERAATAALGSGTA